MIIHERVRQALLPILPAAINIAQRYGLPSDYNAGHRPRHIAGNITNPDDVQVILLLAEPGSSPGEEEKHCPQSSWLDDVTCDGLGNGGCRVRYDDKAKRLYEKNPRDFIQMIWPADRYVDRMKKVIITNSFWMQGHSSGGSIPVRAIDDFSVHLKSIISSFPNAIVVASGLKAINRARRANVEVLEMGSLMPPGSNQALVRDTWRVTADIVRRKLGLSSV